MEQKKNKARERLIMLGVTFLTILFCFLFSTTGSQPSNSIQSYIEKYKNLALENQRMYGIPASITLAQAIYESEAGTSVLAQKSNNHFGIKAGSGWNGLYVLHDDDRPQEKFRKYGTVDESYRDHSLFLRSRKHYQKLFLLDPCDYKAWAFGLKRAGYATNRKYPIVLIKIIEKNNLASIKSDDEVVVN